VGAGGKKMLNHVFFPRLDSLGAFPAPALHAVDVGLEALHRAASCENDNRLFFGDDVFDPDFSRE
jgi:hypothetical protein